MSSKEDQLPNRDSRVSAAVSELQAQVTQRYPAATFEVFEGEDPKGTYLRATVDVDDTDEVLDGVLERLLTLQVDEGLPLHFVVSRPLEQTLKQLQAQQHPLKRPWGQALLP